MLGIISERIHYPYCRHFGLRCCRNGKYESSNPCSVGLPPTPLHISLISILWRADGPYKSHRSMICGPSSPTPVSQSLFHVFGHITLFWHHASPIRHNFPSPACRLRVPRLWWRSCTSEDHRTRMPRICRTNRCSPLSHHQCHRRCRVYS